MGNNFFNYLLPSLLSFFQPLPRGIYHYKFIVDGEWRFSPDDPTAHDEHGNINNFIDTT